MSKVSYNCLKYFQNINLLKGLNKLHYRDKLKYSASKIPYNKQYESREFYNSNGHKKNDKLNKILKCL